MAVAMRTRAQDIAHMLRRSRAKVVADRTVEWGLSAARIEERRQFCADPDMHGPECVCIAHRSKV